MDAVRYVLCCSHIFNYEDNYWHFANTSSVGMTGDGSTGDRSNSGGGGPCRGYPELINRLKTTGFVHQQI
jgi:hypothetical protein